MVDTARKTPITRLARALVRFAEEHGLPNGISPGELNQDFTDLHPLQIGRIVSFHREQLNRVLHPHGIMVTDYTDQGVGYGKRIGLDEVAP